jgi:molybdopterin synthase sulfur carrier subunit
MHIELRYFAAVREALGLAREALDLPDEVRGVAALRALLRARGAVWAETLAEERAVRIAFDHVMIDTDADAADTALHDGCEVAFFPPVTGG